MKEKTVIKISICSIIICLMIIFIVVFKKVFATDDKDFCLDTGICKAGLEINTEYGLIKINKENCIKYNWNWLEESQKCNMK